MDEKVKTEKLELIKLYKVQLGSLQAYNTIIWQLPTALFAANAFAFDKLSSTPEAFILIAVINYAQLLGVFPRHINNFQSVRDAVIEIEKKLSLSDAYAVPKFKVPTIKSPDIIKWALVLANTALLAYGVSPFFLK